MWSVDEFDPQAALPGTPAVEGTLTMRHLASIQKIMTPDAYPYRALMVEVYKAYQNSHEWKAMVARIKERDENRCRECGKDVLKNGVVHHRSYDNWGKGDEMEMRDCVFVCRGCHGHLHKVTPVNVPFWAMTCPERVMVTWDTESKMVNNFIGSVS